MAIYASIIMPCGDGMFSFTRLRLTFMQKEEKVSSVMLKSPQLRMRKLWFSKEELGAFTK